MHFLHSAQQMLGTKHILMLSHLELHHQWKSTRRTHHPTISGIMHSCPDFTPSTRGGDSNHTVSPINIAWDTPVAIQDNQTNCSTSTNISSQTRIPSKPAVPKWVELPCMQPVSANTDSSVSTAGINPIADVEVNAALCVYMQTWRI